VAQHAIDDRSIYSDQTIPTSSGQVSFYQVAILPPGTAEVRVFYATDRAVKGVGRRVEDYSNSLSSPWQNPLKCGTDNFACKND
jgi:hypothetical protein